ncbi:multicopper oxidase domain-containing protein [Comamonas thiooxydans]|uniref:multicopper oxidase domain-containing protein n=1 Tax=Comamonas thiooxydans TaxID=363952 RepID=UPI00050E3D89|nr:multicopper oxidase domain-containing protein [Comamonas thiooxydans]KGH21793.1 hypothetical protein P606_17085 [Comamonas thiooxydans]
MMGESALPDGAPFPVFKLQIQHGGSDRSALPPQRLSQLPQPCVAVNFNRPNVFNITMGMMTWGRQRPQLRDAECKPAQGREVRHHEIWGFRNDAEAEMMGMAMPHAMHVHGLQFRVIVHTVAAAFSRQQGTVKAGLLDEGWKDAVLLMPGERVRLLLSFKDDDTQCCHVYHSWSPATQKAAG